MEGLHDEFLASVTYLPTADRERVKHALETTETLHANQRRESGEPFIVHPLSTALNLSKLEAGRDTLIAALLHDAIEDGHADVATIQRTFGPRVAKLVDGITKLSKFQYEGDPSLRQVASLRKLLLVASEDIRVILIKIADRLHNIETIGSLRPDKQQRIARETLDIYVPFARIVGLWDWKRRLEEACFPIAQPNESGVWHQAIAETRAKLQTEREQFVRQFNAVTEKRVKPALVLMTDFELYQRLYGDLKRLDNTSQVDSARVVIDPADSPLDCYQVLGAVHVRYSIHSLSFRDFINAPQPSGYRGLHTTVFLSRNHELRLRIQTKEMHEFATHRKISAWIEDKHSDIYTALSSLNKTAFDRLQYVSDLKATVLDRMNVFTVAGEIISLPRGATGVDFAFTVNPDYLFSLAGVRVNGELVEATHELHDGDTVELALQENGEGSPERRVMWVEKVKSVDARESLKQQLGEQSVEDRRNAGKTLLEYEVRKWRLPLWWLFGREKSQQRLAHLLGETSFDDVLEKVGTGQLAVRKVVEAYREVLELPSFIQRVLQFFRLLPRTRVLDKGASIFDIDIYAVDQPGMIYNISKCFAERRINISKFAVFAVPPHDALYQIRFEVRNFDQFSDLYDALLQVPHVKVIERRK